MNDRQAQADAALSGPRSLPPATRWITPVVILVPWLALIGSWQTALFPPAGALQAAPPAGLVVGIVVVAIVTRLVAPSMLTHVVALAVATAGVSLLAAQIGSPLANATADYCGDFCRTAILLRFITFFGWPILLALVLAAYSRRTRDAQLASWTRAWALVTLVAGLVAAASWWRTILPNG